MKIFFFICCEIIVCRTVAVMVSKALGQECSRAAGLVSQPGVVKAQARSWPVMVQALLPALATCISSPDACGVSWHQTRKDVSPLS